jgi:hypothetical protein
MRPRSAGTACLAVDLPLHQPLLAADVTGVLADPEPERVDPQDDLECVSKVVSILDLRFRR